MKKNLLYSQLALPKMLSFNTERLARRALEIQVESLQAEVRRLKEYIETNSHQIELLKKREREREATVGGSVWH